MTEKKRTNPNKGDSTWGFGGMSLERRHEIASKGGRASHDSGKRHKWTSEQAREAGKKGGRNSKGGRGRVVEVDLPKE